MNKKIIKLFAPAIFIAMLIVSIKLLKLDTDERFLNFFARIYFDQEYYLKEYPELQHTNIDPFEHYVHQGWKEGKNPAQNFETNFYINLYLLSNKHKLNPLADYFRAKISFKKRYTNYYSKFPPIKLLKDPKYYISLVAIFQNEARFLKEWIEFYRLIGVEHFYLYNHLSSDNYMEVLEPYIKKDIVELTNLLEKPRNLIEWNELQIRTYTNAAEAAQNATEWLIVVDTDEFLFPVQEQDLKSVLKKYDKYPALSVNWKIFGSGKINRIEDGKLLIESLLWANPTPDLHVKTIVKPRYVKKFTSPHFALLKDEYPQVTENLEYFYGPFSPRVSLNTIRINHYWARDLEFFKSHKLGRVHVVDGELDDNGKKAKIDSLIRVNEHLSSVYDGSILKYGEDLRPRVFP